MVKTLTDEEIRVKVAELMGKCFHGPEHWEREGTDGDMELVCKSCNAILRDVRPPDYLNDAAAALQLCDRMHSEGWSFVISRYAWERDCIVTFYSDQTSPRREYKASDHSLARAVTLCFLAAHSNEIQD